jgi:hypothetical protein
MKRHERIPKGFEVRPLKPGQKAVDKATCGHCGLSWDDDVVTSMTPAPSGRCPFEEFHIYEDEEPKPLAKGKIPRLRLEAQRTRPIPGFPVLPGWAIGPASGRKPRIDVAQVHLTASQKEADQQRLADLFVASPQLFDSLCWAIHQLQGDSGTGHTLWQEYPEYMEALKIIERLGGDDRVATTEELLAEDN